MNQQIWPYYNSALIIDLQWLADDDAEASGRTEEPTDIKVQRLR
jgi:hypothetical protein